MNLRLELIFNRTLQSSFALLWCPPIFSSAFPLPYIIRILSADRQPNVFQVLGPGSPKESKITKVNVGTRLSPFASCSVRMKPRATLRFVLSILDHVMGISLESKCAMQTCGLWKDLPGIIWA